jgi:hypothetical protein
LQTTARDKTLAHGALEEIEISALTDGEFVAVVRFDLTLFFSKARMVRREAAESAEDESGQHLMIHGSDPRIYEAQLFPSSASPTSRIASNDDIVLNGAFVGILLSTLHSDDAVVSSFPLPPVCLEDRQNRSGNLYQQCRDKEGYTED